jgi:hypothetical protein
MATPAVDQTPDEHPFIVQNPPKTSKTSGFLNKTSGNLKTFVTFEKKTKNNFLYRNIQSIFAIQL